MRTEAGIRSHVMREDQSAEVKLGALDAAPNLPRSPVRSDVGQGQRSSRTGQPASRFGKRKVGQWSDAQMAAAMAVVEGGGKIRAVARNFDIQASTLADHVNGRVLQRKKGPPTVLTQSEEKALEEYILKMQEYAYPLSMDQLRLKVAEMVQERVTPFRDGILGNGWIN